ncbi:MAG: glutamine-hydrolyzing GMP synthase, partial [Deltaproteobacteria bacterium]|nr:glutamine-hydrolyzing GMP synthase [Deltaproteobacteria bacterium]
MHHERILILDFGSQYTQLIARRIREQAVYSEIHPFSMPMAEIRAMAPAGIVLSGGPSSCYDDDAPTISPEIYDLGIPVLAICYGAQLTARLLGGKVVHADKHEYGRAHITVKDERGLFHGFHHDDSMAVWMSHGDRVEKLPEGFELVGESSNCPAAAFSNDARRIDCVQFHPEVAHTPRGAEILGNFLFRRCQCKGDWSMASFVEEAVENVQEQTGEQGRVICGLSGGVDSSVVAALVHRAIGD